MSTQVVELSGDEAALLRSLQKVIDKEREHERQLGRMADAGDAAGTDLAKAMQRVEDANSKAIKGLIGDLGKLGPEGKAVASRLQSDLQKAGAESAGGMESILGKLRQIDPTIAQSAAKIRVELAEADASTRFDSSLSELRKFAPEAAKAADKVRSEMSLADRQVKFDGIIAELKKVDPAAAAEAAKLRGTLEKPVESAKSAWAGFAESTVAKIGAVAGAYLTIQKGVEVVTGFLKDQEAILDRSLQRQLTLAKAQQEAAKNLAAFTRVQQSEILTQAVPQLALETGVGDTVAITNALGGVASAGATEQQAISAVRSAALLNRLTPEKIAGTASAAIDIGKGTGNSDARSNLAVLLSTGTQARIEDPAALSKSLSNALLNAVNTVPGQAKSDATREAAAIFATLTQASTDKTGQASQTATLDLTSRLQSFFTNFEGEQRDARSALSKLLPKVEEGTATESEVFKAQQLQTFIDQAAKVQDSGTLFGRLETLQQNTGIKDQFFSSEFGQIAFKQAFKQLADSSTDLSQQLQNAKSKIEVDSSGFERILDVTTSLTPQLRVANYVAAQAANAEVTDAFADEAASLKAVRQNVSNVLLRTREEGFTGYLKSFADESFVGRGGLTGSTFAEESVDGLTRLRARLSAIQKGGITESERPKVVELEAEIERLRGFLLAQTQSGVLSEDSITSATDTAQTRARRLQGYGRESEAQFFESIAISLQESLKVAQQNATELKVQNQLMAEQNELLRETADNTAPAPIDPAFVSAAAIAQEDSQ